MKLKIKKLHPDAQLPSYAHPGDAGMDLFALEETVIDAGERKTVKTGISMEIPGGYVGLIWDKSGLSHMHGIKTLGGVIDAGYWGEVGVGVINLSEKAFTFEKGHKIAQMLVQKICSLDIVEVVTLSDTPRGIKGFGSTGR